MDQISNIALFLLVIILITFIAGVLFQRLNSNSNSLDTQENLASKINEILPQIQCAQCGYPGCKPYSEAIATGVADINLCPPGGEKTMLKLAELLNREPQKLLKDEEASKIAFIREEDCIGCTLCIKACPVDAIVGANKLMHVVLYSQCTGCDLCAPVCPVDCIDMLAKDELPNFIKKNLTAQPR